MAKTTSRGKGEAGTLNRNKDKFSLPYVLIDDFYFCLFWDIKHLHSLKLGIIRSNIAYKEI